MAYGFVLVLAYSRYLYVHFYPRQSLEFFLDGHISAFAEVGGVAHRHRYDNLKSVVIRRKPELLYNAQFVDFASHYGFTLHACTPGRANEKGRVERAIRDINDFLRTKAWTTSTVKWPCGGLAETTAHTEAPGNHLPYCSNKNA